YGVTEEDFAQVAVAARKNAARHPQAQMRTPITVAEVLASKPIATPLKMLDCCLLSDGGAAIVVSAADAAKDLPSRAISLLGHGQTMTHEHIVAAPSLVNFGCREAATEAMAKAGVGHADIDVAQVYDSFTITLL